MKRKLVVITVAVAALVCALAVIAQEKREDAPPMMGMGRGGPPERNSAAV